MLKPDFPKKGIKGRNGKKEKEKMKIKKRTIKKKEKEGFPIKDWRKERRKRSEENRIIPDSMKGRGQEVFKPDKYSAR